MQCLGHRMHHQGLGQAGHSDEQGMAAGQHGGQNPIDDVFLAHDALRHLAFELGDGAD